MIIKPSTRKDKRYEAIFNNGKIIHFGLRGGNTYIDHGDKIKRENYIKRHAVNENFSNPYSASALSRYLTWGPTTNLEENHKLFMKKFNIS